MPRRKITALAVAVIGLGLLSATSFASPKAHASGRLKVLLEPCCSTLPVSPGQPPRHYGPRWVRLRNRAGVTVVRRKIPMSRWSTLTAPVGRYDVTSRGCSSDHARVTTHTEPRVTLTCPVP